MLQASSSLRGITQEHFSSTTKKRLLCLLANFTMSLFAKCYTVVCKIFITFTRCCISHFIFNQNKKYISVVAHCLSFSQQTTLTFTLLCVFHLRAAIYASLPFHYVYQDEQQQKKIHVFYLCHKTKNYPRG